MVDKKPMPRQIEPANCILFATADWDEPYWTNKQHSANELTRLGWRVLYVESLGLRAPKAASKKDLKRLWRRLKKGLMGLIFGPEKRADRLWVLSPMVVPGAHGRKWIGRLNQFLLKCSLKRFVKAHKFINPMIWTYHPFMLGAIENLDNQTLLYHCVDDLAALPGVDAGALKMAEENLIKVADVVFVTAKSLEEKCRVFNSNTFFLPNVVDVEHFASTTVSIEPEDLPKIPKPRLFYHGVLSDFKVNFELLIEIAKKKPEWQFVLIGEEREGQKSKDIFVLRTMSNVHFLGFKTYEELPAYLRCGDIGLLPSRINEYTNSMFPMKYYEYLASGLPVVSTNIAFTRLVSKGLLVGDDAESFITAIECQLLRGRFSTIEIKLMIEKNTWSERMQMMLAISLGKKC